jgi:FkbM family methyltransferase
MDKSWPASGQHKIHDVSMRGKRNLLKSHHSVKLPRLLQSGRWEPHLFVIFDHYLRADRNYVDMGAFIGATFLYAAHLAGYCYAIEPNPLSYRILMDNLALNHATGSKVTAFEGCIWRESGSCTMVAPGRRPHTGATSMRHTSGCASWEVKGLTFAEFVQRFGVKNVNFIKMDIEGAESIVLPTMKEYLRTERPTILVSVHAFTYTDRAAEISAVIDSLSHYRYLYRRDGLPLDVHAVLQGRGRQTYTSENSDILASDSPWIRHK